VKARQQPDDFYPNRVANSTAGAGIGDNCSNTHSGFNSGIGGGALSFSTTFSMAGLDPTTA
jgi:hypothetical protein